MPREALFDLAVNRALQYTQRLALAEVDLTHSLLPWYQRTRFAYRIPLEDIIVVLKTYPTDGKTYFWQRGQWQQGSNPRP